MKINPRYLLALLTASSLAAAPLTKPTAVHARPDASTPAVAVFDAGAEAPPTANSATPPPAGWTAVELVGPHEVYVQNKDITKSLDVRPGTPLRVTPKVDGPVLTTMEKGDNAEISGLHGKWTQIRLQKKIVGYIATNDATGPVVAASAASSAANPVTRASAPAPASQPPAPAPTVTASNATGTGRPAQTPSLSDDSLAIPRLFEGTLATVRRGIGRRPYDYQLNDKSGVRYAYLDLSRLLQTDRPDRYVDGTVVVYGMAKPIPDTKEIVIVVESLQTR